MTTQATAVHDPEQAVSADQALIQMLTGMWTTRAVATAARLNIPELLASGPRTAAEIAAEVGADSAAVRRLMRALQSLGLFAATANARYELTPLGERFRADAPGSLKDMFIAETDTVHWRSWERLIDAVRTGEPQPQAVFGMPAFDYYAKNPAEGEQFGRAMENVSRFAASAVLEAYDFAGARTILDIGGGNGSMVLAILERYPQARGVVVDLPYIETQANERIRMAGASDRCRFEPGDFFERVPEGADLHVLKSILHDWSDEEAVRLLRKSREAMARDGRLLVIELVVSEDNQPGFVPLMDLNMLVMTGGMERTAAEYASLFERAGFQLSRVIPTASPFALIEAKPALRHGEEPA